MSRSSRERFIGVCVASALAAVAFVGCGSNGDSSTPSPSATPAGQAPSNPSSVLVAPTSVGKVMSVNSPGRFAVIVFPLGQVPAPNTTMVVYRSEAKVGEVKITGPTQENVTVGDIVLGSVQVNDEVRSN